jgi:NhaA family Na+:H+ antiporter
MRLPPLEQYYACPKTVLDHFREALQKRLEHPSVPGLLLLLSTLIALLWANSPWGASYEELFFTHFVIGYGDLALSKPLVFWINDGLMAIFFFLVGLEIKQELLQGELSSWRKAALPVYAAVGGMAIPALIFTLFNYGLPTQRGWAIPSATDIAFAIGLLSLLGHRVPFPLHIFLLSLAIADDIGAVLIIALFYTEQLALEALIPGIILLGVLWGLNRLRVQTLGVYAVLAVPIWLSFLSSGVHPTIAGVLVAFTLPIRPRLPWEAFRNGTLRLLSDHAQQPSSPALAVALSEHIERASTAAVSPLHRALHGLHPWVNYGIMPVFALANAGVQLELGGLQEMLLSPVTLGVALGLFLGKQIGIFAFSWASVRLRLAMLPKGVRWSHIYGVALLAGIGFTMSLFIAGLSYGEQYLVLNEAKLGILLGSFLSAVLGIGVLQRTLPKTVPALQESAEHAH